MDFKYDFFIAHSASDSIIAKRLYALLESQFSVFLDTETLVPGDVWDEEILKAQRHSAVSLIIISDNTEGSFYLQEEIAVAIEMHRENARHHRVVPLYVGHSIDKKMVPYGLKRINGIKSERDIRSGIVQELYALLTDMRMANLKPFEYLNHNYSADDKSDNILRGKKKEKKEFQRQMKELIEYHHKQKSLTYLIYMDIDGFNSINKKYGKVVGDKIITIINQIVKKVVGGIFFKNISSDEFVICPLCYTEEMTIILMENIKVGINKYDWSLLSNSLFITASFGYSELEIAKKLDKDRLMNEWIIKAIHGCYKAKKSGGNLYFPGPFVLPKNIITKYDRYGS